MKTASPETEKKNTEYQRKVDVQKKAYDASHKHQQQKPREHKYGAVFSVTQYTVFISLKIMSSVSK